MNEETLRGAILTKMKRLRNKLTTSEELQVTLITEGLVKGLNSQNSEFFVKRYSENDEWYCLSWKEFQTGRIQVLKQWSWVADGYEDVPREVFKMYEPEEEKVALKNFMDALLKKFIRGKYVFEDMQAPPVEEKIDYEYLEEVVEFADTIDGMTEKEFEELLDVSKDPERLETLLSDAIDEKILKIGNDMILRKVEDDT